MPCTSKRMHERWPAWRRSPNSFRSGRNGRKISCCGLIVAVEDGDDADEHFVNADTIAAGLSAFAPDTAAVQAGRIMLARIAELARQRQNFAFETTLASRSFAPFLRRIQQEGYLVRLVYVWVRSPKLAVDRVAARVRQGGHQVPEDVVRRRYGRGLLNFLHIYRPLANIWAMCDNSGSEPVIVARGEHDRVTEVLDQDLYERIERSATDIQR
jgi:predicted ABC-type ATPase